MDGQDAAGVRLVSAVGGHPQGRLAYYASQFPLAEVDSTYYAPPNERTAALWADRTWGGDLSDRPAEELADLAVAAAAPQPESNIIDEVVPVSVLPEQSVGWIGVPGVTGHRDGAAFSTAFTVERGCPRSRIASG